MWTVNYISFGKQPVAARPQGSGLALRRRRPPPYGRAATGYLPKAIYRMLTVHTSECIPSSS